MIFGKPKDRGALLLLIEVKNYDGSSRLIFYQATHVALLLRDGENVWPNIMRDRNLSKQDAIPIEISIDKWRPLKLAFQKMNLTCFFTICELSLANE